MTDSIFITALSTLAGVIGLLWKINQTNAGKIEKRADTIEKKNDENTQRLIGMSEEVGELRGEIGLAKKVIPKIEDLHNDFLKAFPLNDLDKKKEE